MKTKTTLLGLLVLTLSVSAFSQTTFGVRGGVNFYNLTGKDEDGEHLDNDLKVGFELGANAEIPIGVDFYVQPGVLFATKGAKTAPDYSVNLSYIEIPVNLLYKPDIGKGHILLGFGPYAAFAVDGKYKTPGTGDLEIKFKNDITATEFSSGNVYLKRFDAGANLLFGYEFANNLSVQLNAGLGLINLRPDVEGNSVGESSLKNTGFGVSLGYRFKK